MLRLSEENKVVFKILRAAFTFNKSALSIYQGDRKALKELDASFKNPDDDSIFVHLKGYKEECAAHIIQDRKMKRAVKNAKARNGQPALDEEISELEQGAKELFYSVTTNKTSSNLNSAMNSNNFAK